MKQINGKTVKVTRSGYVYIDGKKVSRWMLTPVNFAAVSDEIDDTAIIDYLHTVIARHWRMVQS